MVNPTNTYTLVQITVLAIACAITTLSPRFRHPTVRAYRAAMYLGLGFSAFIFIIHGIIKYGADLQRRRMSLDWMIVMTTFNVIGALTYAVRVIIMVLQLFSPRC
jgi:adiponectin receptor